jgi:hypothetical protein
LRAVSPRTAAGGAAPAKLELRLLKLPGGMLARQFFRYVVQASVPLFVQVHVNNAPARRAEQMMVTRRVRVEAQEPTRIEKPSHEPGIREADQILVDGGHAYLTTKSLE